MAIPTIDMIGTGQNICRLRLEAGISVKELQDIFGFSTPQAIYKWQHGTALPTIDNLIVLAAVLGVKVDDILVLNDMQITMPIRPSLPTAAPWWKSVIPETATPSHGMTGTAKPCWAAKASSTNRPSPSPARWPTPAAPAIPS